MDILWVFFCLVFVMPLCASVCHFPIGFLCQVWCLIVSISDLCPLTYFTSYMVPEAWMNGI